MSSCPCGARSLPANYSEKSCDSNKPTHEYLWRKEAENSVMTAERTEKVAGVVSWILFNSSAWNISWQGPDRNVSCCSPHRAALFWELLTWTKVPFPADAVVTLCGPCHLGDLLLLIECVLFRLGLLPKSFWGAALDSNSALSALVPVSSITCSIDRLRDKPECHSLVGESQSCRLASNLCSMASLLLWSISSLWVENCRR